MGVSQHATVSMEDIADAAPGAPLWFQLYILKDRALTVDIVRRWVGVHLIFSARTPFFLLPTWFRGRQVRPPSVDC